MRYPCLLFPLLATGVGAYVSFNPRSSQRLSAVLQPLKAGTISEPPTKVDTDAWVDEISPEKPLRVVIAGAGVGGLVLANKLTKDPNMHVQVLERTAAFKRFGGPIQLASNALQILSEMDGDVYDQINEKFTVTGDKMNGIKDGIRTDWYAKFDLKGPAEDRNMPYTGVIERPDLQDIYLKSLPEGTVKKWGRSRQLQEKGERSWNFSIH